MIMQWFRRRRRRKILSKPFPQEWIGIIEKNVAQYEWLNTADQEKLRRATQVIVREKYWEGCQGLVMTDEIRVTIAAQASFLLLGLDDYYFDRLLSILVYPDEYVAPETIRGSGGFQIDTASARLGEAWHGGPVILSWNDVLRGSEVPDDGTNVVLHEFAHVLDMHDKEADGVPPLDSGEQYRTWKHVMSDEYQRLVRRTVHGRPTLLNQYGATNEAEFFAVATECFFEEAVDMQIEHPELYDVLKAFYRQDPAERVPK